MKTLTKSIYPAFAVLALGCFAVLPQMRAVSPAPDGGYTGWNTAEGQNALFSLTNGGFNTAIGGHALYGNTTGSANTAVGAFSLAVNSSGDQNVAVGQGALRNNIMGNGNTAVGYQAAKLTDGVSSNSNTAIGFAALDLLTQGDSNTAIGANALDAISSGGQNIAVGSFAGGFLNSGNYNIYIGSSGDNFDNDTIRIGDPTFHSATYIAGIYGQTASSGIQVYINSDGQLGTLASSERFKKDIANIDKVSEAILSLRPVTFRYKTDTKETPQFGLIAEEAAQVNPALVLPDKEGKPYTVRYEVVNAMLLNEFLKEHKAFLEEQRRVQQLEANAKHQQKQIDALSAGLQKVSAQLQLDKAAPETVLNSQ